MKRHSERYLCRRDWNSSSSPPCTGGIPGYSPASIRPKLPRPRLSALQPAPAPHDGPGALLRDGLVGGRLARRHVHDELGALGEVPGALGAFHGPSMPRSGAGRAARGGGGPFKLTHYRAGNLRPARPTCFLLGLSAEVPESEVAHAHRVEQAMDRELPAGARRVVAGEPAP